MPVRTTVRCWCALLMLPVTLACVSAAADVDLTRVCAWRAYDPGESAVGTNPDGYWGTVFDGRYVYFVPYNNGVNHHGEVLRYDTQALFEDPSAWAAFDPGASGVGINPNGYMMGIFDGRYVYFVPFQNDVDYHGEILRYDTQGVFTDVVSWTAYDPGADGIGNDADGFIGAAFDGRYIYFAPYLNGTTHYGDVLRYDTTGAFADSSSWVTYDAGAEGVGDAYGYAGAIFDGRYVYFVPNCTTHTSHHGEVRRYDTTGDFSEVSSWAAYDPGAEGLGNDPDGYVGAVFDGRHIYFVPYWDEPEQHGEFLRFDTYGDFASLSSWNTFDPEDYGIGTDPDGYHDGVFDGRYVYFVPYHNGTRFYSEVLQYDTTTDFLDPAAWGTFDPGASGITNGLGGHAGGTFDGRYIYFAPLNLANPHGEVLRFDTSPCPGDFNIDGYVDDDDYIPFVSCLGGSVQPGCEPGDFDSDTDVDCDDWEAFVLAWTESGVPIAPPQCPCPVFDAPQTEDPIVAKNRHLSFIGGNPGMQTAMRVTLVDLPAPFDEFNETIMWVGEPSEYCENAGQDQPPAGGCGPAPGLADNVYTAARLQCEPLFRDWGLDGVINVYHEAIVPGGTYVVQSVEQTCDRAVELNYSPPLEFDTSVWGDVVMDCTTDPCGPPDGSVGISTDVTALLDKFKNLAGAPRKARSDIEPTLPDQLLNITDVTLALDAFRGITYPFEVSSPCP